MVTEPSPKSRLNSVQTIQVRQPQFKFDDNIPRHWCRDNAVATHGFNAINLLFPASERFFIQTVVEFKNRIDDPGLAQQIAGFAGQEAMHAVNHELYFKLMEKQGYRFNKFLQRFSGYRKLAYRSGLTRFNIATTAAAEHYTATYAAAILTEPSILEGVHPEMKRFIIWHACEEMEHRSVSYDVMQYAKVGYPMRITAYILVTFDIMAWLTYGSFMLLKQDGLSLYQIWKLRRKIKKNKQVQRQIRKSVRNYFRPGFHPSQIAADLDIHAVLKSVGIDSVREN